MRRFRSVLLAVAVALAFAGGPLAGTAGAQSGGSVKSRLERQAAANAAPEAKSHALPYFVVVLAIALGLLIVCRSARRAKDSEAPVPTKVI